MPASIPSFDIAPMAPRHSRGSWRLLAIGAIFVVGCSGLFLQQYQRYDAERETQAAQAKAIRADKEALRLQSRAGQNPTSAEATKAKQHIQNLIRTSWFSLFDALEGAALSVRSAVSLLTLAPEQTSGGLTRIRVTAMAANMPALLDYLRALLKNPQIQSADIISQQAEPTLGPNVIRAQIVLTWDPSSSASAPALAPASTSVPASSPTSASTSRQSTLQQSAQSTNSQELRSTPVARIKTGEVRP